jgi:hypothetical protein
VYFVVLVSIFYTELHGIRSAIRRLMCDTYFQEGRLFYFLCRRRTITRLFSVLGAGALGISLLLFVYLADTVTVGILFLDIFIFAWWRGSVPNIITEQLTDKAGKIVVQIFLIGINVASLFILFLTVWGIETYAFTPEATNPFEHPDIIAATVVAEIKHSCYIFRTIARFGYAFSLTVEGLQTLPGLGKWLYPLFYLTNLSLLPFIGITLLYSRFYSRR